MNFLKHSFSNTNKFQTKHTILIKLTQNTPNHNKNSYNSVIKTNSFNFSQIFLRANDYFFKKQEYDRAFKFLSEEMKDIKSILVYSRKFPYYPVKLTLSQILKYTFSNAVMYLLYANGIYNFIFIWVVTNIWYFVRAAVEFYKNSRKVSSIFLIKTQNDFTNETEFYFIIGYGFRKNVKVINLLNFHSETRAKIEKHLFLLDDSKLINLGFNIQFVYWYGQILIFNREIFKFFFKQERLLSRIRQKNQMENEYEDLDERPPNRRDNSDDKDLNITNSIYSHIFQNKHH